MLAKCFDVPRGAAELLRRWNKVEPTSMRRVLEWRI
jgi:hypothetical protein